MDILAFLGFGFLPLALYLPLMLRLRKTGQVSPASLGIKVGLLVALLYFIMFKLAFFSGFDLLVIILIFATPILVILGLILLPYFLIRTQFDCKGAFGKAHPWPRWQWFLSDYLFLVPALGGSWMLTKSMPLEILGVHDKDLLRDVFMLQLGLFAVLFAFDFLRRSPTWKNPVVRGLVILGTHALAVLSVHLHGIAVFWLPCTYLLWRALIVKQDRMRWEQEQSNPAGMAGHG